MVDLRVLGQFAGAGGVALAAFAVVGGLAWLVLLALAWRKIRVPATLWWFAPTLAVIVAAVLGWATTRGAPSTMAAAEPTAILAIASTAEAQLYAHRALGFFWVAVWCAGSAVALSLVSAQAIEYPYTSWLSGALPLGTGMVSLILAAGISFALQTPPVVLIAVAVAGAAGVLASSLVAVRTTLSRSERPRVDSARVVVVTLAIAAPLSLGAGLSDALRLWPTHVGSALPAGAVFALAVAAAGLPALSASHADILDLRSGASVVTSMLLWIAAGGAIVWTLPAPELVRAARGGAVADLPDASWDRLTRTLDLADQEPPGEPLNANCLITEGAEGWQAEPLFAALAPSEWIARTVPDPDAVHELDRAPGCTEHPETLEGPLAATEVPVIALDASRAAPALSGTLWFRKEGELLVLARPDPVETASTPSALLRADPRGVRFHWEEVPPAPPRDEEHPAGVWDAEWARQLPVTLLEGPYPVLIADGEAMRLPPAAVGKERLELILRSRDHHRRDLVLIPRKEWTVQDLVSFCTSIRSVEDARCVIRPETPARWSLRTGLPLPW